MRADFHHLVAQKRPFFVYTGDRVLFSSVRIQLRCAMLFSSITFLYFFLPSVLLLYFAVPFRLKNLILLGFSLLFYAWGEPVYVLLMAATIVSQWVFGLLIERFRGTLWSKFWLIVSLAAGLGSLGLFKYADFFLETVRAVSGQPVRLLGIALPIGISFYTFQILSYTIDLYRGEAGVQRNVLKLATYVTLFPQLIAGPIVRYTTVAEELDERSHSWAEFSAGARRFTVGLGKKVLIANLMGQLAQTYKDGGENTVLFAWMYAVAFSLQLYFDFSGYSDMAIGLGHMFGFHFLENFNYPYIAQSITEFWRRWHMSLGTWFRDYVYIPLGGNRQDFGRNTFNLFVVWFLTGFWHGAGWNFIVWGLYFAVLLMMEKPLRRRVEIPAAVGHVYTIFAVMVCFVLFDAESLAQALVRIGALFGAGTQGLAGAHSVYYLRSYAVPLLVGVIGATPLPKRALERLCVRCGETATVLLQSIGTAVLLVLVTAYLIDGSFNPFIYFRF